MTIHGLQKMTLLDFPGHVACTVFTAGCNLRCPFCHNAPLVTKIDPDPACTGDEFFAFLEKRRGVLDGVAITGGEPLMQDGIRDFIERIRSLGYKVKLDTNGTFPDRLRDLIEAGLVDYVAMDVKNCREKYAVTAGCEKDFVPAVTESIRLLNASDIPHEFRTTVCDSLHTPDDIRGIAEWIAGADRYFIQPFSDSGDLVGERALSAPDRDTLDGMKKAAAEYVPGTQIRGVE